MNAPLGLTYLRILSIPILVAVLLSGFRGKEVVSFSVFSMAMATDMLDGFWARRRKQITVLGQLLDPTADKLLVASTLICLVELRVVAAWMAVVIIGRELAISGFRAMASAKGIHIPASFLGKLKMIFESGTICLLLLGKGILGRLYILAELGLWLTIGVAVISAAEYYIRYGRSVLLGRLS